MDEPLKILVVEDEPTSRHLVQEVVRSRGHHVEACADAETAWSLAQRETYDMAVLDVRLPGMDGVELARRLLKLPGEGQPVVLILTAVESRDTLEGALEAGVTDYIVKPISPEGLDLRIALGEREVHRRSHRRLEMEEAARAALQDRLTGLANRVLFIERLERTGRRAVRENRKKRERPYLFAVLCFNLDGFAAVNRIHGRTVADEVLRETALRLEDAVRSIDTVARDADDEFVILLDSLSDVSDPTRVARRIQRSFATPVRVGDVEIPVSACVGMAFNVTGFEDPHQVFEDAGRALLRAKSRGSGSHEMFDEVAHARALARLELESRLRTAIEENQLVLYYQPIVSVPTGQLRGFEALVRWEDPERGLIQPDDFIGVAEDTGMIIPLGWWTLEEACRQLRDWQDRYPGEAELTMAVNVSGRQFEEDGVEDQIAGVIDRTGISPDTLHLEITETAFMHDFARVVRVLERVKEGRISLDVDDFGTGYSSLSYLARLPIDTLKIDRSFISQMTYSSQNLEVVRTIARLARNLGLHLLAEGVETESQLEELRVLRTDSAQGFLFGRPAPPEEVEQTFLNGKSR